MVVTQIWTDFCHTNWDRLLSHFGTGRQAGTKAECAFADLGDSCGKRRDESETHVVS